MEKTSTAQIRELSLMSVGELGEKYAELFGEESRSRNKPYLIKRIAYRIQELAEGCLSERIRERARQITDEAHLRVRVPEAEATSAAQAPEPAQRQRDARLPAPGTVLVRDFGGRRHEVTVRALGFEYQGKSYRSLSAVARAITGTPWNGFRFFALEQGK